MAERGQPPTSKPRLRYRGSTGQSSPFSLSIPFFSLFFLLSERRGGDIGKVHLRALPTTNNSKSVTVGILYPRILYQSIL